MILTVLEYAEKFPYKGRVLSAKTIARRCADGLLPSNHHARQLPGNQGQWVIDIPDEAPETIIIKPNSEKSDAKSISRKFYNFK